MSSLEFIYFVRDAELDVIVRHLPPGGRVLEVGAGAGRQALELQRRGFEVVALDVESSNYAADRLLAIIDYDGQRMPFADGAFDAVFSSNVLEHVADLSTLHAEIRRVLKPGGTCVHVLPTHVWRTIATLAAYPAAIRAIAGARSWAEFILGVRKLARAILPRPHGERGNFLTEIWYFRPAWWRRNFIEHGFDIVAEEPLGLFYTAAELNGIRLSAQRRRAWARRLGSSTHLFKLSLRPELSNCNVTARPNCGD